MSFENKISETHTIFYSQYIAAWLKTGLPITFGYYENSLFYNWLKSTGLTDKECHEICLLADNGKLELEESARRFAREHGIN